MRWPRHSSLSLRDFFNVVLVAPSAAYIVAIMSARQPQESVGHVVRVDVISRNRPRRVLTKGKMPGNESVPPPEVSNLVRVP